MKRTNKRCSPVIKGGKVTKVSKDTKNIEWVGYKKNCVNVN